MKDQDVLEAAVEYFASRSHNAWRRNFHKANPKEAGKPRLRQRGGAMVDINKPWRALDPRAQADNRRSGYDAQLALDKFPKDREAAAAFVHQRWMQRNRRDPSQPKALFKAYHALPEHEKDKDRAHVDNMKAALAAVKKKRTAKKKAAARTPAKGVLRSVTLDAKTAKRFDAVAKRLSVATGRKISSEQLILAGLQAMASLFEATAAK